MVPWKLITFVYMVLLTIGSLLPGSTSNEQNTTAEVVHNALHFPAYAILAFLIVQCFRRYDQFVMRFTFILAIGYGILMEIGQSFIPNRFLSLGDVCTNSLGVLFTIILVHKRIIKIF